RSPRVRPRPCAPIRKSSRPTWAKRFRRRRLVDVLKIENLTVNYGAIRALHGISLSVPAGGIVTLIGSNGAGKSTTLRAISGLVKPQSGTILYEGEPITGLPPHRVVARGLCQVPEGRLVFAN